MRGHLVTSTARRRLLLAAGIVAVLALGAAAFLLLSTDGTVARAPEVAAVPQQAPVEAPKLQAREVRPAEAGAARDELKEADGAGREEPMIVEKLGARRVSCAAACALEARCGLRTLEECTRQSCEGEVRKALRSDFDMAALKDCGALAENPCEEACWRRGECTGDHEGDRACTAACRTLVKQAPRQTYRESRCVLERPCADLPLCAERG